VDTNAYLEIRYQDRGRGPGYDCWGLVWLIYQRELGISLPSYSDEYPDSDAGDAIQTVIDDQIRAWIPVDKPRHLDLVILKILGKRMHCGIVIDDRNFMHCLGGAGVSIERFGDKRWCRRISGIYRHAENL